jgi:cytochrome d ubiquinol oxidase subunit II
MWLNTVWFILFIVLIAGYLILDGFDLGVGILHLIVAKDDHERRIILNSIGPVWDGNEVWLVVGVGVLFAAFPEVYASLFSGFYTAIMFILLFLILRTVAIDFRSKEKGKVWRSTWDGIFFGSSLALALSLGIAFGNIIAGVPLDSEGVIRAPIWGLLSPFSLLIGGTTIVMLAMHGALYLNIKTEGALQERIQGLIPVLMVAFVIFNTLSVLAAILEQDYVTGRYLQQIWPVVFPAAALGCMALAWRLMRKDKELGALLASGGVIGLLIVSVGVGVYPNLLISKLDPAYNLTIFNAASAPNTLMVMLIITAIGMPFVLLYTFGVYYIFRGKVRLGHNSY